MSLQKGGFDLDKNGAYIESLRKILPCLSSDDLGIERDTSYAKEQGCTEHRQQQNTKA